MSTTPYYVGQVARLTVDIEVSDVGTDPDALTFTMLEPDGTETTYTNEGSPQEIVGHPGNGSFYVDWVIAQSGRHFWKFVGTGDARGATEGEFWARRTNAGA
jgi:hypothetical protein